MKLKRALVQVQVRLMTGQTEKKKKKKADKVFFFVLKKGNFIVKYIKKQREK